MAKHVSAYRGAGLNPNRITKKTKKEWVSAYTSDEKNRGGLLGGVGYVAGNLGLGLAGIGEGVGDIVAAGTDVIRGDTDMAKYRFLDNKTAEAQQKLRESYNPGAVMEFAGDVASGIGQSSVFLLDAVAPGVGTTLFFTGVGGQGVSSAAQKTGDVGWREVGYGVASGVAEGLLEKALGAGSKVAGKIGAGLTRSVGETVGKKGITTALTKSVGKKAWSSIAKATAKDASGEFAGEFASEYVDTALLHVFGIDPNASTSLGDAVRAGMVGLFSGGIMGAPANVYNFKNSAKAGKAIRESGETENLLNRAQATVSVLKEQEAIKRTEGKRVKPAKDGETATEETEKKDFFERMGAKREASRAAEYADKLEKNIKGYRSLSESIRNSEAGDALLGELRGNLYFTNMAYAVEEAEIVLRNVDDAQANEIVKYINTEAKKKNQPKSDYTVEDFRLNRDGILSQFAALGRMEQILKGDWSEAEEMEAMVKEAAESPAEAAEAAEGVQAEEADTPEANEPTEEIRDDGEAREPKQKEIPQGRVVVDDDMKPHKDFSDTQYAAYKAAETLSKVLGAEIHIRKSLERNGRQVNGYYEEGSKALHININAMRDGKQIALYTLGHEVTHYIKNWSAEKFDVMANFVAGKLGTDMDTAVDKKLSTLRRLGLLDGKTVEQATELAREEVVADGMELIFTDGKVLEELARTDKSLWQKIRDWFFDMIGEIRRSFESLNKASKTAQVLKETMESLDEVERLFIEGVREAGERTRAAGVETKTQGEDIEVRYSVKDEYDSEKAGIADQIRNSQDKLNRMDPVYVSSVPNNVGNKEQGGTWAISELKKYGFRADRQNFGTIFFDEKSIRDAMNYLDTNEEKASIVAIFKVLKQGIVVGEHGDHKSRNKHTITFGAPVVLNGIRGNMAVVVNMRNNKYYVHRILMPDGSTFKFDVKQKDAKQESQRGVPKGSLANATSSASKNSISQPSDSVNSKFSISEENASETAESPDVSENGESKPMTWDEAYGTDITGASFRQALAEALEKTIETDSEYKILKNYSENIAVLNNKQKQIDELNATAAALREKQFYSPSKEERSAAAKELQSIYEKRRQLEDEMAEGDGKLEKLRQTEPIRNIVRSAERAVKEQSKAEEQYKADRREMSVRERTARRVIGRMNTMFYKPTRTKHVPEDLQALVEAVLKSEKLDTFKETRKNLRQMTELEREIEKLEQNPARTASEQERLDKMLYKYAMFEDEGLDAKGQATALYTAFKTWMDSKPENQQDKELLDILSAEIDKIQEMPLSQMSKASLEAVEEFYKMIYHQVKTANQLHATERILYVNEEGGKASKETRDAKPLKLMSPKPMEIAGKDSIRRFFWKNMKPLTVFEAIGSKTFLDLFKNVMNGENVWARDITEARETIVKLKEQYGYDKWDVEARKTVKTSAGDVQLSISQIMSLYAYSFRDQAKSHLMGGGFKIDPNATTKAKGEKLKFAELERRINDETRHTMTEEEVDRMYEYLTEEQKSYVKEMQAYLTSLGKKGNEVSRKLYGIDIFKEDFYFPIKVSSEYLQSELGKTGDPKIKNRGMTKEVVPDAKDPLVLQDFMDVAVEHINSMATYHAFVLPMEDLTRVLNYKPVNYKRDKDGNVILDDSGKPVADKDAAVQYDTLKSVIQAKYGTEAVKYIEQLMRDLNGGARRDAAAGIIDRGITAFKRASTMASLSVLVQQPTSILRAAAYIDYKYLFGNAKIVDFKNHKALWERVKKYAPVAAIKEMGGYDTGVGARTGDYLNSTEYGKGERVKGFIKDENYRADVLGKGAAYADEMAWIQLFEACVSEQADKLGKNRDSEEVLTAAGERFTEVVRHTQVYDSTLTRSESMRSKDTGAKMFTAFMAEPTTVVSMVAEAIMKAERGDTKFLRATAGAVAGAVILNALFSSLVYAMRDDDEDKSYGEKYLSTLAMETAEGFNPAEYLPYTRDIMSLIKGYEVERSDMSLIGDLVNSIRHITSSKQTLGQKMQNVGSAVAAFFGLPVANVMRDVNGAIFTFFKSVDTERFTGKGLSVAMKEEFDIMFNLWDDETTNGYQLYRSAIDEDGKHFARVAARYETDKEVEQALRKALRSYDKRIHEAAMARMEGELEVYEELIGQIVGEGHFDRNITIRAINNQISYIKDHLEDETVPENPAGEDSPESIYSTSDLNDALERGDSEDFTWVYHTLLAYKKEQGTTEAQARSSIKSSVSSYWKKQYLAAWDENNSAEMRRILSILLSTGLYGNHNETATTLEGWVKTYAKSKIKK